MNAHAIYKQIKAKENNEVERTMETEREAAEWKRANRWEAVLCAEREKKERKRLIQFQNRDEWNCLLGW